MTIELRCCCGASIRLEDDRDTPTQAPDYATGDRRLRIEIRAEEWQR